MTTRGRALRYTAVSALVVLCLTGFSTGRHGGGDGGGGGGGCSSSGQDHDSSSSSSGGDTSSDGDVYKYDDDSSYGGGTSGSYGSGGSSADSGSGGSGSADSGSGNGSSGSGGSGVQAATVELVSCATADAPYATVEITNPNGREYSFAVTVLFKDGADDTLEEVRRETAVPARGTSRLRVPFDTGGAEADHCELRDDRSAPLT
ncbi:hypothetical protein ABZ023_11245 [Streptomyces sp. NPDC006367]|uniref:hypothetical protein n=1 Tax=unclassified Streptomyces TaxID=2593676 RepID=UPI0033B7BE25